MRFKCILVLKDTSFIEQDSKVFSVQKHILTRGQVVESAAAAQPVGSALGADSLSSRTWAKGQKSSAKALKILYKFLLFLQPCCSTNSAANLLHLTKDKKKHTEASPKL